MANSFSGPVSAKSLDTGDSRPPFDTGWHPGAFSVPNQATPIHQQQRESDQRSSNNTNLIASEFNVGPSWSRVEMNDPSIDRFDDVPLIRTLPTEYAPVSGVANTNVDNTVESLNSCPLSDLINDEVPVYHAQPEFQQVELPHRTVYNTMVKDEPSMNSFIPQPYNHMPPNNNNNNNTNFLPTTTNTLPLAAGTSYQQPTASTILDTSASALRAAGFCQSEYLPSTALPQSPYDSRRARYDYVPPPPPVPHRQHHTSGNLVASAAPTHFPNVSSGYAFRSAPIPGPLATGAPSTSNTANFQSLQTLNNSASSFQSSSSDYYTQQPHQFRNPQFQGYMQQPGGIDQQSSFVPRPIRERFLSAPGGAYARMDQISSFFGNMQSNFSSDFQNERSRSPYSRSSSAGVPSPWCPSPLQPTLQMGNGVNQLPGGGYSDSANVVQFAEINTQNAYFWQYNTQSKQRGHRTQAVQDPYSFDEEFRDPIFANDSADNQDLDGGESSQQQLRHPGKARRGDGTDTTPNPTLLFCIGNLLSQLNNEINGIHQFQQQQNEQEVVMQNVSGKMKHASGSSGDSSMLPSNRREKNMLASRVCRLKRKAQHEANKIIMAGLKQESESILRSIAAVEDMLRERILASGGAGTSSGAGSPSQSILQDFRAKIAPFSNATPRCAGRTSEFVSDVLQRVSSGDSTGGLKGPTVATTSEDVDSDNETSQYALSKSTDLGRHPTPLKTSAAAQQFSRKRHNSSHPRLMSCVVAKAPAPDVMADARYSHHHANNFSM